MHLPTSISKNCLKVYNFNPKLPKEWDKKGIKSFNIENWDFSIPKQLRELCVETLAKNWEDNPVLDEIIQLEDRYLLLDLLSENLPLEVTIPRINDEIYWKKCFLKRWPKKYPPLKTNVPLQQFIRNSLNEANEEFLKETLQKESSNQQSQVGSRRSSRTSCGTSSVKSEIVNDISWKRLYVETHVQEYLESLEPERYNPEKMKNLCDLCGDYLGVLRIDQMLCSLNSPSKIPLNAVVTGFRNLRELSLCFKQAYARNGFSWNILTTTYQDIALFAKGLQKIRLRIIRIRNSDIDCDKAIILLKALLKHDLEILDLSHCKIGNKGALGISKFTLENSVKEVILVNNRIGSKGIKALAYSLTQTSQNIQKLNLRLNQLSDEAANWFIASLTHPNCKLRWLSLAGSGLTKDCDISKAIQGNSTLYYLDISNNALNNELGQAILESTFINSTLLKLDVRMCKIKSPIEAQIQQEIDKNKRCMTKTRTCKTITIEWPEELILEIGSILSNETETQQIEDESNCEIETKQIA
ncbi:dynein regulatory complex subunit 5-like [Rhynchophorus ferrugineus]|uniref:Uncharacterized protein n=1 Tax=Rhynchophorus ferrugineus TaxID=354439 RepID=A0A834M865_RHYFE|nr:hypothetical protein GWI33_016965 [Rhynchophorus ferrugineus]